MRNDHAIDRQRLLRSLRRQRAILAASIVLTPVDNLQLAHADRIETEFLHSLYLSDKLRSDQEKRDAVVQFSGRGRATRDITEIYELLALSLNASVASMRMLSGLHAHAATFMSIASSGQSVLMLSDRAGGHFSTAAIFERIGLKIIEMPVERTGLRIDRERTLQLIDSARPDFAFIDRSEGLKFEDFSYLGKLRDVTTIFDASQYLPQILSGRYPNPLDWGFDLMLFSLHKSFPGPQKAAIVGRENGALWARLNRGLSTLVSSSHAENTYLAGLTLLRGEEIATLADRMCELADCLQASLGDAGLDVVDPNLQGEPEWPNTQHIWIRCENRSRAFELYQSLVRARIHTNYRLLPYDLGYGLRLGTSFAASAGLDFRHIPDLAKTIGSISENGFTLRDRHVVREIAEDAWTTAIADVR